MGILKGTYKHVLKFRFMHLTGGQPLKSGGHTQDTDCAMLKLKLKPPEYFETK